MWGLSEHIRRCFQLCPEQGQFLRERWEDRPGQQITSSRAGPKYYGALSKFRLGALLPFRSQKIMKKKSFGPLGQAKSTIISSIVTPNLHK